MELILIIIFGLILYFFCIFLPKKWNEHVYLYYGEENLINFTNNIGATIIFVICFLFNIFTSEYEDIKDYYFFWCAFMIGSLVYASINITKNKYISMPCKIVGYFMTALSLLFTALGVFSIFNTLSDKKKTTIRKGVEVTFQAAGMYWCRPDLTVGDFEKLDVQLKNEPWKYKETRMAIIEKKNKEIIENNNIIKNYINENKNFVKCYHCGEKITSNDSVCKSCNTLLINKCAIFGWSNALPNFELAVWVGDKQVGSVRHIKKNNEPLIIDINNDCLIKFVNKYNKNEEVSLKCKANRHTIIKLECSNNGDKFFTYNLTDIESNLQKTIKYEEKIENKKKDEIVNANDHVTV